MEIEVYKDRAEIEEESINAIRNFLKENMDNIHLAISYRKKGFFNLVCIGIKKDGKPIIIAGRRRASDSDKWWTGNFQAFIRIAEEIEIITENPDFLLGKTRNRWIEIGKIIYQPTELEVCKYCDAVLRQGDKFCSNCGSYID